jgi:hypothetical protein
MDNTESSAPHADPSTEDHDDTVEAHYACLERLRPHACTDGWALRLGSRTQNVSASSFPFQALQGSVAGARLRPASLSGMCALLIP